MKRRQFLTSSAAALVTTGALSRWPARAFAQEQAPVARLAMPPLLDTRSTGCLSL
jgi:blue copper oxidase